MLMFSRLVVALLVAGPAWATHDEPGFRFLRPAGIGADLSKEDAPVVAGVLCPVCGRPAPPNQFRVSVHTAAPATKRPSAGGDSSDQPAGGSSLKKRIYDFRFGSPDEAVPSPVPTAARPEAAGAGGPSPAGGSSFAQRMNEIKYGQHLAEAALSPPVRTAAPVAAAGGPSPGNSFDQLMNEIKFGPVHV